MAHEEHTSRFANSLSKKSKRKKVPQRGMGVAQLEKIILEERQLKDAAVLTSNSVKFRRPSISLPPRLPPNHHWLISESDVVNPNQIQNQNRYIIGMPANQGGFGYVSNSSTWTQFPAQKAQFQQSCSSSMVNVPLGTTSSASSSVMNIEPPSIQSFCANKYPSFMPDRDKMVELKRSYPFSMENMPIPSFNCNVPSAYVPLVSKSDESTTCTGGGTGTTSLELTVPFRRENPSGSVRDQKTKKFIDENLDLTTDFLTLAPPRTSPASQSSLNEKLASYQGQTRDPSEIEWSNQQSLHSFFPSPKSNGTSSNGEVGEHVDLSLKL